MVKKIVNDPFHGQALMEIEKRLCTFCIVGVVAPELLSAFVIKGKMTPDIKMKNRGDHLD